MSVLIKDMDMPRGCIYANDKDQTEYCPLLNHDDVPFCQYIEDEPEAAIGIDERPVYCPLTAQPEQKWIPVTESTLPEEGMVVIAKGEKGTWDFGTYRGHGDDIHFWHWKKNTFKRVYWWMYKDNALPEPYREDEEE